MRNEGDATVILTRLMVWTLALGLLLALPLACGGEEPTDREVDRKAERVAEKAAVVALMYGFGGPGECGDILDRYADEIEEAMEEIEDYGGDSNSRKMSLLEDAEEKLDRLGEELDEEGCI